MSENENKMKDIENKMSENENKMSENENKTSENDYRMPDIDNTKLEEVMASYAEKQDKERLSQLVFALKDTELFIPTMIKPNNEGLKPYIIKNPEGDLYMPSFTSIKKIPLDQKYQGMLKMKYMQCVSLLLDKPSGRAAGSTGKAESDYNEARRFSNGDKAFCRIPSDTGKAVYAEAGFYTKCDQ